MQLRRLILVGLLVAAAASLIRELATRNGVGPIEYAVGIVLVAVLLAGAVRLSRRAVRRA
jgi:hypothetical protein